MPSRMAADWSRADQGPPPPRDDDEDQGDAAGDEPDEVDEDQADDDEGDEDQGDGDGGDGGQPAASRSAPGWAQDGAGWVLGLLFWGWVALPFLQGGPPRVGAVLRAKFLNQSADGSELP